MISTVRFLHCFAENVVLCHSFSSCCFFFYTLLHLLVVDPLQYSSSIFCSVVLLICHGWFPLVYNCTLLVCLFSFIRNTCPSYFNRICLILLDTGTCCVLCLVVSFVILSLCVIRIIFVSQRFPQASSRFSICLVKVHDSLAYVNFGTTQHSSCY